MKDRDKNIFDRANDYIRDSESSLVNFLSAIAPWGAPLAPATMSYRGMIDHLKFSHPVALIIAAVIEILGLATVHTTLLFWQHNRRYKMEYKKQPTALAAGMFGLYLVIILSVNVILEAYEQHLIVWAWTPITARALLSLLAVPAAVTMAIRTQHTELLRQIQGGKMSGNLPVTSSGKKRKETERNLSGDFPATSDWRRLPDEDRELVRSMSAQEIAQKYRVSERTGRTWKANALNHNGKAH